MFIVHTMEEIQGLMDAHSAFKATLGEADKEYNSIVGLVREVESIVKQFQIPGGLENPYTTLTALVSFEAKCQSISLEFHGVHLLFQDLTKKWSDVRQLVPQRDGTLAAELRKQQSNFNFQLFPLNLKNCISLLTISYTIM